MMIGDDDKLARWIDAAPHVYARKSIAYDDNADFLEGMVKAGYLDRIVTPTEIRFVKTIEGAAFLEARRLKKKVPENELASAIRYAGDSVRSLAEAIGHAAGVISKP